MKQGLFFMEMEYIDLYTLQNSLKLGLEDLFPEKVWVRAEIASVSRSRALHSSCVKAVFTFSSTTPRGASLPASLPCGMTERKCLAAG